MSRGLFITFEGVDGSGKSTQIEMLAAVLKERRSCVITTREPGGCLISERIRDLVLDAKMEGMSDICETFLFAAARAQHMNEVIRPALNAGMIVLCDRFVDSSIVYQGIGRRLGMEFVQQINALAITDCTPDITVLFDIDPSISLKRRLSLDTPDRIEKEKKDFMYRIAEGYHLIAKQNANRYITIDAMGSQQDVFNRLLNAILKHINFT